MLSVAEFDIKKKEAIPQAIKDAYFHILFRGIPSSTSYKDPLLGTDEYNSAINNDYYRQMIEQGRLYSFITYSSLSYYKKKEAIVKLTINMRALIADMEKRSMYKRFGLY